MMAIAAAAAEIVLTILVFGVTNLAILALRNPHKPAWLRSGGTALAIEMVCISAMLIVVPLLGAGVYGVVPNLIAGSLLLLGLTVVLYVGISHLMTMDKRLADCDAGLSPFRSGYKSKAEAA